MAAIRNKEIISMKTEDMMTRMDELRRDLIKENGQRAAGGSTTSPGKIKQIKKTIARIKFVMGERNSKQKSTDAKQNDNNKSDKSMKDSVNQDDKKKKVTEDKEDKKKMEVKGIKEEV